MTKFTTIITFWLTALCNILLLATTCCNINSQGQPANTWAIISPKADSISALLDNSRLTISNRSSQLCDSLEQIKISDPNLQRLLDSRVAFWKSWVAMMINQNEAALRFAKEADELIDDSKYPYDKLRIQNLLRFVTYMNPESPYQQYVALNQGLKEFEEAGDYTSAADNLNFMGITLYTLGEYGSSLQYFEKAATMYQLHNSDYGHKCTQLNIAEANHKMGNTEAATKILHILANDRELKCDTPFYAVTLVAIAAIDNGIISQQRTAAIDSLSAIRSISNVESTLRESAICIADYLKDNNDHALAISYYKDAISHIPMHLTRTQMMATILKGIGFCYDKIGNRDSAYYYLTQSIEIADEVKRMNPIAEMEKITMLSEIRKYEDKMKLQQEAHQRSMLLILLICIICAIIVGIWFYHRHKRQILRYKLREAENRELSLKLENERLEAKKQQLELELRNRQLIGSKLEMTEKEKLLKTLLDKIADAKRNGNTLSPSLLQGISNELARNVSGNDQWDAFRTSFEEVNPNFYATLKDLVPSITDSERRLCAFLHLGLPRKQIAVMLNVQTDSVKKAVTRLRKKFNLAAETSLEDFLNACANGEYSSQMRSQGDSAVE